MTACGGGGGGGNGSATVPPVVTPPSTASVTSITPVSPMYGKSTTITVAGKDLNTGITLVAPACTGVAEVAGGTATQRSYTCTPNATGAMAVSVQANGATLASVSPVIAQPQVTMKTSLGDIVLELYPTNAPITVTNFLQYVNADFYTNLVFHRVIPGFVIQGGGFNAALQPSATRAPIKLEVANGLSNSRGTIAMARTAIEDSATSQFFINTVDNNAGKLNDLDAGRYAVFGKVVMGLNVVDQISAVATQTSGVNANVPVTPVVISSAKQTQ